MLIHFDCSCFSSSDSLVPFLNKEDKPEKHWLRVLAAEFFDELHQEQYYKQLKYLMHHPQYGDAIQSCLLRLFFLESGAGKNRLGLELQNHLFDKPWRLVTHLHKILARPPLGEDINSQLYLIREELVDTIALEKSHELLHQYFRFFAVAHHQGYGVLPLAPNKHLIIAQHEMTDTEIQDELKLRFSGQLDDIDSLFLLMRRQTESTALESLFNDLLNKKCINFSEDIVFILFKIIHHIPINQEEIQFVSNSMQLTRHIPDLFAIIIQAHQLDTQQNFIHSIWRYAEWQQGIFDYLSVSNTSQFLSWLLSKNYINQNFKVGNASLMNWAIAHGDDGLFNCLVDEKTSFSELQRFSAVYSGNKSIATYVLDKLNQKELQSFLSVAVKADNLAVVHYLFSRGVAPKLRQDALHALARKKNFLMIEAFIKRGFTMTSDMITDLIEAHDLELFDYLLTHHPKQFRELQFEGVTLDGYLIKYQKTQWIELLIKHKFPIDFNQCKDVQALFKSSLEQSCGRVIDALLTPKLMTKDLLKIAIKHHQLYFIKHYIKEKGCVDIRWNGLGFLVWAASHGYLDLVSIILKETTQSKREISIALVSAARKGYRRVVKQLISAGADVNYIDDDGETALTWSAYEGYYNIVAILADVIDIDLNQLNDDGMSPLSYAISKNHKKIAILLFEKGAELKQSDIPELIRLACETDDPYLFDVLTKLNFGKTFKTVESFLQSLTHVSKLGLKLLLNPNHYKETQAVLLYALDTGNLELLHLLKQHDMNFNQPLINGKTPLMLAIERGHLPVIEYLLNQTNDFNYRYEHQTALDIAVKSRNVVASAKLIEKSDLPLEQLMVYLPQVRTFPGHEKIFAALLAQGMPLKKLHQAEQVALLHAVLKTDNVDILEPFLKKRSFRQQALWFATRYQSNGCFEILHRLYAPFKPWRDKKSCSPLIWAIRNQNLRMTKAWAFDFYSKHLGNSSLEYATYFGNFEINHILLKENQKKLTDYERALLLAGMLRACEHQQQFDRIKQWISKCNFNGYGPLGHAILKFGDEDLQLEMIAKMQRLTAFTSEQLEFIFLNLLKQKPEPIALLQKMLLSHPKLITHINNDTLLSKLLPQDILLKASKVIKLYCSDKAKSMDLIETFKKIQSLISPKEISDIEGLDIQLDKLLKLKLLDEWINKLESNIRQSRFWKVFMWGKFDKIKKIDTVYHHLSEQERLALFEQTSRNHPLVHALNHQELTELEKWTKQFKPKK